MQLRSGYDVVQGPYQIQLDGVRDVPIPLACGKVSTVLADMDFETYSEAGYLWNESKRSYDTPRGAMKKGISAVGAAAYAEHPSTEVLCLAYDLKDGLGPQVWMDGLPPPERLFEHVRQMRLLEAWNCLFEAHIWREVCQKRLGWPALPLEILRDAMAAGNAFTLPGKLSLAADAIGDVAKIADGKKLIQKFSIPRKPTKNDERRRIKPSDDPADFQNMVAYCVGDIEAEADVSNRVPDLSPFELEFWQSTLRMNLRGVAIDTETLDPAIRVLESAIRQYNLELATLTEGEVTSASQAAALVKWVQKRGVLIANVQKETVENALEIPTINSDARRALEIRQLVGSAGPKKLLAMKRQSTRAGRLHDMFVYHRARTGRDGGADVQPQNLVKDGPKLYWCSHCGQPYGRHRSDCPHCMQGNETAKATGWSWKAVPAAVAAIRTGDFERVEEIFGDALLTLSGIIRGMFVSSPGHALICSDFSSIEAVVTAVLANEEWRIQAFRDRKDIYLISAGDITGMTLEQYEEHRLRTGEKHKDRQKIGKPAELGLGFGGWIGAWRQFDKTDTFDDDQVRKNILSWRNASPEIVELWGGQFRGPPFRPGPRELFGLEGVAVAAIENPGQTYTYRLISYQVRDDKLFARLPSGRELVYHEPRLTPSEKRPGLQITFMGYNTNPKMGPIGWTRMRTYGGSLCENVVQATARDIMAHSAVNLEKAGYHQVLRVHDEIVCEVPESFGSIEEFETIMSTLPDWATGWPVRAAGGWIGDRYRKD